MLGSSRVAAACAAVLAFAVAIPVLQKGTASVAVPLRVTLAERSVASAVGLGWIASYFTLSGSSVCAAAFLLLDQGTLGERQCLGVVVGSRAGPTFATFAIGLVYALRRRERPATLGVLAFLTTQLATLASLALSLPLLAAHLDLVPALERRTIAPHETSSPGVLLLVLGLAGIVVAFRLVERALPGPEAARGLVARVRRHFGSARFMFGAGALLTLVAPTTTVSIGLLLPLESRGYLRQARVVPYLLGAAVTGFSRTLLAAVVVGSSRAVGIVLLEVVAVALVALAMLPLESALVQVSARLAARPAALAAFAAMVVFGTPLVLLLAC